MLDLIIPQVATPAVQPILWERRNNKTIPFRDGFNYTCIMKVIHLLSSNKLSGAENVVCQIIDLFRNDPNMNMVYVSRDGPIRETLSERKISFFPIDSMSIRALENVFQMEKPDIIHAHDMRASTFAALSCGKTKLISHIHNNAIDARELSMKSIAFLLAAYKAQHIYWVSKASLEDYRFYSLIKGKSSILSNVVNVEQLRGLADTALDAERFDIVFLGRLSYPKNPQRMINVLKEVLAVNVELTAAIIGTGEYENEIRQTIEKDELTERIRFKGYMQNPYGILRNAKVMLMTSRWEGLPMCALESLALGTPIVSTPTDGLVEIVKNGYNGFLSEDDSIIAKRLIEICSSESLRQSLSSHAETFSEEYNDIHIYRKTLISQYLKTMV